MSSRVDRPDPPPGESFITLIGYAARHGMPYQLGITFPNEIMLQVTEAIQ
jgi:hypothetical protein